MKVKIQRALFPNGVHFDGEAFGTSRTNLIFSELAPIREPFEGMVDLTVVSSNLFLDWIREADALRRAAA